MKSYNVIATAVLIISTFHSLHAQEDAKDTSGTNPTLLLRNFSLNNEYQSLSNSNYFNALSLKFTQPFNEGKMSLTLKAPAFWTDISGDESGLGDISLKWAWVASVDQKEGWVTTTELFMPTGDDFFTSDKWTLAPGVAYVRFLSPEVIVAPAYVHSFSFAGNDSRPDIHSGTLDLYLVWRPKGEKWWITSDLTFGMNYEDTDQTPMSFEVQYGRNLGKLGSSAVNGFIRPGVGFGDDRPYDWNIECGLSIVGF